MVPTIAITSNDGDLNSASAVMEVSATNADYNQPVLRIKQAGKRGGAASLRIDDPNPDIEFVEIEIRKRCQEPLLSKTGRNPCLLVPNPLKSVVAYSGCESRSPGCADAVLNPDGVAAYNSAGAKGVNSWYSQPFGASMKPMGAKRFGQMLSKIQFSGKLFWTSVVRNRFYPTGQCA